MHEHGGPEVLCVEEVPEPRPGDLLVRVHSTTVNHRDAWIRKGHHPHPACHIDLPAIPGIDISGVETGHGQPNRGLDFMSINSALSVNTLHVPEQDGKNRSYYDEPPFSSPVLGQAIQESRS